MELLILAVVAFGFYKMNKKSNEYKQLADEAQTKLDTYVKANQSAESIVAQAKLQAQTIVEQANNQSTAMMNEANDSLYTLQQQIQEREQVRNSIPDLTEQANALEAKIERR